MITDAFVPGTGGGGMTVLSFCLAITTISAVSYVVLSVVGWLTAWRHGKPVDSEPQVPWVDRDRNMHRDEPHD